jgi:hypothetical protein
LLGNGARALGRPERLEREQITPAGDRLYDLVLRVSQGLPHVLYALHERIVGHEHARPHCPDQFLLTDDPPGVFHQIPQDVERFGPQLDHLVAAAQGAQVQVEGIDVESLEFEDRRNLAPDFVEKLKVVGAFKVLVPTEAGGLGGSLPQFLELPWQWPRPTRRAGGWRRMPTFAPD